MKWFIPSWNGDLRLVSDDDPKRTILTVEKPTLSEQKIVNVIGLKFKELGYVDKWDTIKPRAGWFASSSWRFVVNAPISVVGPIAAEIMRPGPAVLTAVQFSDGKCLVTSDGPQEVANALAIPAEPAPEKAESPKPEAAATVKRATPCCPQCIPGAVMPATEALLAFLTEEQHNDWARRRCVVAEGNLSGHHYLLAHRHTAQAQKQGRICFDLDDGAVVHFHDWTVPPEEEVLASMLILQHREHWLRNEATCLSGQRGFKNPFGDGMDGVADSSLTTEIGAKLLGRRNGPALPEGGYLIDLPNGGREWVWS